MLFVILVLQYCNTISLSGLPLPVIGFPGILVITHIIISIIVIFHTEDVDKLYSYMKNNHNISDTISFENEPKDASSGERYFHISEPDGYQLSFATPIKLKNRSLGVNRIEGRELEEGQTFQY
jgi:hypothetical protein